MSDIITDEALATAAMSAYLALIVIPCIIVVSILVINIGWFINYLFKGDIWCHYCEDCRKLTHHWIRKSKAIDEWRTEYIFRCYKCFIKHLFKKGVKR